MRSLNKDYGNKRPLFHQKNHQNRYYQPIDTKAKTFLTCTPIASDGYAHTCTPIASDVGRKVPPRSKWRRFRESRCGSPFSAIASIVLLNRRSAFWGG